MTLEYQRLWRAANGIEDAETAMRRSYRDRARTLREVFLRDKRDEINELGGYCIALCVRAMEREAR